MQVLNKYQEKSKDSIKTCYFATQKTSFENVKWGHECCYTNDGGSLQKLYNKVLPYKNSSVNTDMEMESQKTALATCCLHPKHSKILCAEFRERRPPSGCENFQPPVLGMILFIIWYLGSGIVCI